MKITLHETFASVERTRNGERFNTESALFYAVKKELQKRGKDVIKKRPDKDGHMFSSPYYIRARDWSWCLYDHLYAVRMIHTDFNHAGRVTLCRSNWSDDENQG